MSFLSNMSLKTSFEPYTYQYTRRYIFGYSEVELAKKFYLRDCEDTERFENIVGVNIEGGYLEDNNTILSTDSPSLYDLGFEVDDYISLIKFEIIRPSSFVDHKGHKIHWTGLSRFWFDKVETKWFPIK